uniref:SKICH domain-containing protein n=1 Tax=Nothoprocta perdicaria TaxID=30464 RepID=A0A8C6ZZX9_NOTPE
IAKSTWPVLSGFQEGPLNFPPTFKFDVGTNKYDSSVKKRKPAWTDRILWKIKSPGAGCQPGRAGLSVSQLCYCSHMEYTVSDHKPVAAVFAVQFASKADSPPVEIYVAEEWSRPEQAVVRYRMAAGFHRSSWDWIGLYQVLFSEEALPQGRGDYILGYYSTASSSIVGVTEPFQVSGAGAARISLCRSEEGSDEEDDSTLVLLASTSRSPSPGKMKQHRSRSPTLAKFQGLILRPASRERGASRSPSPQGRRGLCGLWHVSGDTFLARADPRTLGLLPALRLETLDPVAGPRRESVDQGYPGRKMSPSSPVGAPLGSSPRDEELAPGAGQP